MDDEVKIRLFAQILDKQVAQPIMRDALLSGLHKNEIGLLDALWNEDSWQQNRPDRFIFMEMLATAIARNGDANEMERLLTMLNDAAADNDWRTGPLLSGLSVQAMQNESPIQLASAPDIMNQTELSDSQQNQVSSLKQMFAWPGHTPEPKSAERESDMTPEIQALFTQGRQQYLTGCAGCHGTDGAGLARFAPPLVQSEWVIGSEERLTRLVLHGIEGPIEVNGKEYNTPDILPVMPGHSVLDDTELASILTYIRKAWGNDADAIERGTVSRIRHGSQGRVVPWTAAELIENVE